MYKVMLTTVDDVIYEGNKEQCEEVMKAFTKYNGAKNLVVEENPAASYLNEQTRSQMKTVLAESKRDGMFGDGLENDYIWDGVDIQGVDNMSDDELIDEMEMYCGDCQEREEYKLYQEAIAQREIHEQLLRAE
jgi:hypothetical protein